MKIRPRVRKRGAHGLPKGRACKLSLCDPHYIEELTCVWEQDGQKWAKQMKIFLEGLNTVIADTGGTLSVVRGKKYRGQYRKLHKMGRIECSEPTQLLKSSKRKPRKKSRSLSLLDKLNEYEDHLFMFIDVTP